MSSEPDSFFYYQKDWYMQNRTTNDKLKNWLYNNLGNIYCFDKKNMKRDLLLQKITRIQYKNHDTTQNGLTNIATGGNVAFEKTA
jgi:hypothetical protein